jgi:hypothetical protein
MPQAAWSDAVVTLIRLEEGIARGRGQDVGEDDRRNHDDKERDDDGEASEVGAESDDESFHISCSELERPKGYVTAWRYRPCAVWHPMPSPGSSLSTQ